MPSSWPANAPLFVDAARGNFYLASGSQAIDSSLNRLDDRPEMVAVTSPLGIPPAPIVAPDRDRFGQLRIDDPLQAPPPGLGSNIFKDRGAVERADFEGPYAMLILPEDNDPAIDLDPGLTTVLVEDFVVSEFEIEIDDEGIGLDDLSVVSRNVTLILNGTIMTAGTDYVFRYDPIGDVIRLSVRADVAAAAQCLRNHPGQRSNDRDSRPGGQWTASEPVVGPNAVHDYDRRPE